MQHQQGLLGCCVRYVAVPRYAWRVKEDFRGLAFLTRFYFQSGSLETECITLETGRAFVLFVCLFAYSFVLFSVLPRTLKHALTNE